MNGGATTIDTFGRGYNAANRAIELNESCALAFEIRGSVRGKMSEEEDALRDFARAIELNPKPVHTLVARAALHCHAGRLEAALADAERAQRLDAESSGAIGMRGTVLLHTGDFEQAVRCLTKSVSLNPDDAEGHSKLGEALSPDYSWTGAPGAQAAGMEARRVSEGVACAKCAGFEVKTT